MKKTMQICPHYTSPRARKILKSAANKRRRRAWKQTGFNIVKNRYYGYW